MKRITIFGILFLLIFMANNPVVSQQKSTVLFKSPASEIRLAGKIANDAATVFVFQKQNFLQIKDASNNPIWQKDFDRTIRTVTSDLGRYLGVIIHNSQIDENFNYQVFNYSGELQYDYQIRLSEDDLVPIVKLSNLGQSAIFQPEINHLTLISKNGSVLFNAAFTANLESGLEKTIQAAFSKDGKYLTVAGQQKPATFDETNQFWISGNPVLILLNEKGVKLWEKILSGIFPRSVGISPTGKYIATASTNLTGPDQTRDSYFLLFNTAGDLLYQDDFYFDSVIFSENEEFLLRQNRNEIQLVNLKNYQLIFKKTLPENNGFIAAVALNSSADIIACVTGNHVFHNRTFQLENIQLREIDIPTGEEKLTFIENSLTLPLTLDYQNQRQTLLLMAGNAAIELEQYEK